MISKIVGDYKNAEMYFLQYLEILLDDRQYDLLHSNVFSLLGEVYYDLGYYCDALELYTVSLDIREKYIKYLLFYLNIYIYLTYNV